MSLKAYATSCYSSDGRLFGFTVVGIDEKHAQQELDARGLGEILDGEIVGMMDEDEGKMHHTQGECIHRTGRTQ